MRCVWHWPAHGSAIRSECVEPPRTRGIAREGLFLAGRLLRGSRSGRRRELWITPMAVTAEAIVSVTDLADLVLFQGEGRWGSWLVE